MRLFTRAVLVLVFFVIGLSTNSISNAQGGLPTVKLVCEQYIRDQPSMDLAPQGVLYADEPMMLVTGRDVSGGWLVVLRQNGQAGWIALSECTRVQGEMSNASVVLPATYVGPPIATVGCTQYVRSEPDNEGPALTILYPDDGVLNIIGRSEGEGLGWLLVQWGDGSMGWVYDTPCIRVQGDLLEVPVSDVVMPVPVEEGLLGIQVVAPPPTATIGCTQYVRSEPRNEAPALIILYPDDGVLDVIGRDRVGGWLLVRRADGAMGWVYDTTCIVVDGSVMDAPVAIGVEMPVPGVSAGSVGMLLYPGQELPGTASRIMLPEPYVNLACTNYVRSAADNESARLMILFPGDGPLEILARDKPAAWLLVRRADGAMGWVVNTDCINVTGNVFVVPEDTSVVMPIPGITIGNQQAIVEAVSRSVFPPDVITEPLAVLPPEPYARLACANYVRSAADNASARLMILFPGDGPLEIIARDKPAAWLLARWDGGMGWLVNTDCVQVVGNVFAAPEDTSVVMPVPEPAVTE